MSHGWSIFWLAFAVSLDSFAAGTIYGIRKIRIPLLSILIIASCSGVVIYTGMMAGGGLSVLFSPMLTRAFGAGLFVFLGCVLIIQGEKNQRERDEEQIVRRSELTFEPITWIFQIKRLGLVVKVLKTPVVADIDNSGSISSAEAVLLGTALSLDAFGAGIGAAFMEIPSLPTALSIALMSAMFLRLGMYFGFSHSKNVKNRFVNYLPGLILIVLGMLRLI
ncbi:sporulation membrane protein YtaF [Thermoactinomyces mirandus]|uniref:Sporulation membrane protein YtaF n=1 Tax=Thermoactinomyces mirandus TaxID=2756294 RepID=A0A7W1XQW5_9BACL|nr:sporulation membrane protein YtaF [Thermoactinomyces mirandus]MBA4601632.1 sporulation membrane protein YtaF [Thermoactinomyces mirandus]